MSGSRTLLDAAAILLLALQQHEQQNRCMPRSITIRNVPDDVTDELAARASVTGRSLQEYLRMRLIEMSRTPDAEEWVTRVRARKQTTGGSLPVERILSHRDADRR